MISIKGFNSRYLFAVVDFSAIIVTSIFMLYLRFVDIQGDPAWSNALKSMFLVAAVNGGFSTWLGIYSDRFRIASKDEINFLALSHFLSLSFGLALNLWFLDERLLPLSTVVSGSLGGFVLSISFRTFYSSARISDAVLSTKSRVLVFGAGIVGQQLVDSFKDSASSNMFPVAFLDDDPRLSGFRYRGVRVKGSLLDLEKIISDDDVDLVVVAAINVSGLKYRSILETCRKHHIQAVTVPTFEQIISRNKDATNLQKIKVEDLLGRIPVQSDLSNVEDLINGRVVLVTGGGGSIGSELCRQVATYNPEMVLILDRDESALLEAQLQIERISNEAKAIPILADIRDSIRVNQVFDQYRPSIVFHAAALKHLNFLEREPLEAWKTNVIGTHNVLTASERINVSNFVNISTDKAANPSSVLGYSKLIAERLTHQQATRTSGIYTSVRFGNVLASRGSVITIFRNQIAAGGPITVSDPEVTRFFMTISESAQLVLQSLAIGNSGDCLLLKMGEPVKILDVAELLAAEAPFPVEIVFTGLKPGEKMCEELLNSSEYLLPSKHELIDRVKFDTKFRFVDIGIAPETNNEALSFLEQYGR